MTALHPLATLFAARGARASARFAATVVVVAGLAIGAGAGTAASATEVPAADPGTAPADPTEPARPGPYAADDRRMSVLVRPVSTDEDDGEIAAWGEGLRAALREQMRNGPGVRQPPAADADEGSVNFVLRTSVRRAGDGLQIVATLLDRDGRPLLERRAEAAATADAAERGRIARRIAGTAVERMRGAEVERGLKERPDDPDARDLYLRAEATNQTTARGWPIALGAYEASIRLLPDHPLAWAAKAKLLWRVMANGLDGRPVDAPVETREHWDAFRTAMGRWRALTDPDEAAAVTELLFWEAAGHRLERRLDLALAGLDDVLGRQPDHANALREKGLVLLLAGRIGEAADAYAAAVEAGDRTEPPNAGLYAQASRAHFLAGRDEAALESVAKALKAPAAGTATMADLTAARVVFVAVYGLRGNRDEAARMMETIRRGGPAVWSPAEGLVARYRDLFGSTPEGAAAVDRLAEGIRKAGWPD